jgi:2-polyprenyl-6-methoxyphenol hydroxylase-like FAD-dependent oxidoreductase
MRRLDVAIAGAGPAGLAAALYLHRAGHRVVLFERFDAPHPIGSGLMLQPTGQAVLADLGLLGRMASLGAPIKALIGTDSTSGRTVLDVRYAALGKATAFGIHRAALFAVLHDAVVSAGVSVVTSFTINGAEFSSGEGWLRSGSRREGPFDLVVDALGASSPLKHLAAGSRVPRELSYGAIWTTLPWLDGQFNDGALVQRYHRASVMIGVMPVGRQREGGPSLTAFFWSIKPDLHAEFVARGLDAWKVGVCHYWPETAPLLDLITSFEQMTLARYAHHTMPLPVGDGVAFVGDSGHATSPQLGQGANMALLDARALSVALDRAENIADALADFARLRRWNVRLYQALSWALTPMYQSDSQVLPMLRDTLVSTLGRVPPVPRLLAAMVSGRLLADLKALGLKVPE